MKHEDFLYKLVMAIIIIVAIISVIFAICEEFWMFRTFLNEDTPNWIKALIFLGKNR